MTTKFLNIQTEGLYSVGRLRRRDSVREKRRRTEKESRPNQVQGESWQRRPDAKGTSLGDTTHPPSLSLGPCRPQTAMCFETVCERKALLTISEQRLEPKRLSCKTICRGLESIRQRHSDTHEQKLQSSNPWPSPCHRLAEILWCWLWPGQNEAIRKTTPISECLL